jgi:hypothetical protein
MKKRPVTVWNPVSVNFLIISSLFQFRIHESLPSKTNILFHLKGKPDACQRPDCRPPEVFITAFITAFITVLISPFAAAFFSFHAPRSSSQGVHAAIGARSVF